MDHLDAACTRTHLTVLYASNTLTLCGRTANCCRFSILYKRSDPFKDPAMHKRFQDVVTLSEKGKECLPTTVNHFIKASKISSTHD